MISAAQVVEKNHFLEQQNQATTLPMTHSSTLNTRILLFFVAAGLVLALLAPVSVLAASI